VDEILFGTAESRNHEGTRNCIVPGPRQLVLPVESDHSAAEQIAKHLLFCSSVTVAHIT